MSERAFQPSKESLDPRERTKAKLRYLRQAIDALQNHVDKGNDLPHWVDARIGQGAAALGMAVRYVVHRDEQVTFQEAKRSTKRKGGKT